MDLLTPKTEFFDWEQGPSAEIDAAVRKADKIITEGLKKNLRFVRVETKHMLPFWKRKTPYVDAILFGVMESLQDRLWDAKAHPSGGIQIGLTRMNPTEEVMRDTKLHQVDKMRTDAAEQRAELKKKVDELERRRKEAAS